MTIMEKKRSGPKTLFPGKDRARPITVTLTPDGHAALEAAQSQLTDAHGSLVSITDTVEYAIRCAPTKKRPSSPAKG